MTMTTTTTLTRAQFEVAYRLADSQGHTWAIASGLQCPGESISIDEIRKNTERRNYPGRPYGLVSPYVDDDGVVQHTNGELDWAIYPDGAYIIRVYRINVDGPVLEYQSETKPFPYSDQMVELIVSEHATLMPAQVMIQCLTALEVSIPARLTDIMDVAE